MRPLPIQARLRVTGLVLAFSAASPARAQLYISAGGHTCAVRSAGAVVCWGRGEDGRLGYGNTNDIGDDESDFSGLSVNTGGTITQVAAGGSFTCALRSTGTVVCWGDGGQGVLGYGNTTDIGDTESDFSGFSVNTGGTITQLDAAESHTCAVRSAGTVVCWGQGSNGRLGYGNSTSIGDTESDLTGFSVNTGGTITQVAAGQNHACAVRSAGTVVCWGLGTSGQLGYGNVSDIGDDESDFTGLSVNTGGTITQVSAGTTHTCALRSAGTVVCWGSGISGRLGYGNTTSIGDDESDLSGLSVNTGGTIIQVAAGGNYTCALRSAGTVVCWGSPSFGRLGYGNTTPIGDTESDFTGLSVNIGGAALPVELIAFTATADGPGRLALSWITASETDNAGWGLELRSGAEAWREAAFVAGRGTSPVEMRYTHALTGLTPGRYRLRLRQVDFDGTTSYSPEVEAVVVPEAPLSLAAQGRGVVVSVRDAQPVRVEAFDVLGRRVALLHEGEVAGALRLSLPERLGAGMYLIRATAVRGETVSTGLALR